MRGRVCKHFGLCGGCALQDKPYEEQVEWKVSKVEELLGVKVEEIYPSPKQHYYRNRMDYVVAPGPKIGLNVKGSWKETVDLEECLLLSPEADEIRAAFKNFLTSQGLEPWDRVERKGAIRFLTILEGKFTNKRMLAIISSKKLEVNFEPLIENLKESGIKVDSLMLGLNAGIREEPRSKELYTILGEETIIEKIGWRTYHLHLNTFFQPNPYTLEHMLKLVKSFLGTKGGERVLELYSGVGTFTVELAKSAAKVVAVEADPQSIKIAEMNMRANKIKNVELINQAAEKVSLKYDYIVLDPPGSGLSLKLVKRLRKARPKRVVYVSCNPETQARDIRQLGYRVERVAVVDQFPQTPLVETVALLRPR